jgi:hypothetical protein
MDYFEHLEPEPLWKQPVVGLPRVYNNSPTRLITTFPFLSMQAGLSLVGVGTFRNSILIFCSNRNDYRLFLKLCGEKARFMSYISYYRERREANVPNEVIVLKILAL